MEDLKYTLLAMFSIFIFLGVWILYLYLIGHFFGEKYDKKSLKSDGDRETGFFAIEDMGKFEVSAIYAALGLFILIFITIFSLLFGWELFFYNNPKGNFWDYLRIPWNLFWSYVGISVTTYIESRKQKNDECIYFTKRRFLTKYFILSTIISLFVFSVLQAINSTNNYLFYLFSFSVCFLLFYLSSDIEKLLKNLYAIILKKI